MQIIINGEIFDAQAQLAGAMASDGTIIYPDSLAHTFGYDAQGRIITDTVVSDGNTYVQTYAYADTKTKNVHTLSAWVKQ